MTYFTRTQEREEFVGNALEAVIRIGVLLVLVGWCFDIMRPFVSIIVWGIVIAIGSHGLYDSINERVGKRRNL